MKNEGYEQLLRMEYAKKLDCWRVHKKPLRVEPWPQTPTAIEWQWKMVKRPDVKLHLIMQTFLLKPHHLKPSLQLTPLQSKYITVCILGFHFVALQTILLFLFFKTYRAKSWAEDFYDPWLVKHAELNWFRPNSSWGELMLTRERWVKIEESFLKWGNLYATANARQQQSLHSFTGMTAVINDELLVSWGEMIWHCRR